jgi:hypothetical protein
MSLYLVLGFGLDAGKKERRVIGAFLPKKPPEWDTKSGSHVIYLPFLVVLQANGDKPSFWLPYWHLVTEKRGTEVRKYGQWAPYMDGYLFKSLVNQAQARGFL